MHNDSYTIFIVLRLCMSAGIEKIVVHAKFLHCFLFIAHWPCIILHGFHNIAHPVVQHVVHSANGTIVHYFEQLIPTLRPGHLIVKLSICDTSQRG